MAPPLNLLILDDAGTPTVTSKVTYTSFITPGVDANLFIITSRGALSAADKAKAIAHVELDCPTLDGSVELEDLLLRAAHLRRLLGIADGDATGEHGTFA
ncbi:hypothetical protein AMAG_20716 [Allomyces macrogynus ATCC 38327]|uniref:Uncharacterized protein n=1 Tax=Allomyces macrogynus (strain ATCC 38327) TaxID=578462 RepID=A0A0L0TF53_ALLM3|nr:hypothetical protein AMAG_20716 [Allomyces macrogynus ATCC 38327]|eukprot:KNE73229.1 hypothetical protein AMAG_20716 [Allomyces macrogynus ATCC 38327]